VQLKYANEWNGFQFTAGVGYEVNTFSQFAFDATVGDPQTFSDNRNVGFSVALKHVPSGLFIQGDYLHSGRRYDIPGTNALTPEVDMDHWNIQAGISKNWFGLGNTNLYAECGEQNGWGQDAPNAPGFVASNFTLNSHISFWGVGAVQNIEAAAMELYSGWRTYSADAICGNPLNTQNQSLSDGIVGPLCTVGSKINLKDLDIAVVGARIKF
jgi:hypothetical protein